MAIKKKFVVFLILVLVYAIIVLTNVVLDVKIGFDMDDTLIFSSPAFVKADKLAYKFKIKKFSPKYWEMVNGDIENGNIKKVTVSIAILARAFGIDSVIITARPDINTDKIKKYWEWLTDEIYFTDNSEYKSDVLKKHRFICFFGDSDSDITEAMESDVFAIRIQRSPESSYKQDYKPGKFNEFILPLSAY
ncbi:MAG: hypothetical protein AB1765_08825 [Candidatus Hydrogenedentota bacterium]